ncbi:MAG: site-specific integrase [Clostridia bacterium]|nr:site-specific integrase [Clostridia bacterium]
MINISGSVHAKGKYYYAVFRDNGKQKWINTGIEAKPGNKRKAKAAMERVIRNYFDKKRSSNKMLLTNYLLKWIVEVEPNLKPSTYEDYEKRIKGKIIPYFDPLELSLDDVTPGIITKYLNFLKNDGRSDGNGGLKEKTVKEIKNVLSSALKDAVKDKLIPYNPVDDARMPVYEMEIKEIKKVYGIDEIKKLLAYAKAKDSHVYTFLVLIFMTGIRKGEAMALDWTTGVDFENRKIIITKNRTGTKSKTTKMITTPKSDASNRVIPMSDFVYNVLKKEKEKQDAYKKILGKAYPGDDFVILSTTMKPYSNLSAINRVVNRLIDGAGLSHSTIHDFRHSVATLLDSNGIKISEIAVLLGHASVDTTEKNYINRINEAKKENINILEKAIHL